MACTRSWSDRRLGKHISALSHPRRSPAFERRPRGPPLAGPPGRCIHLLALRCLLACWRHSLDHMPAFSWSLGVTASWARLAAEAVVTNRSALFRRPTSTAVLPVVLPRLCYRPFDCRACPLTLQGPTQHISGPSPTLMHQLLGALLRGEHTVCCALLPSASPADLAAVEPLSLYHAAALYRDAEAVRLLAAAGVPAAAADSICNGVEAACLLGMQETTTGQLLSNFQGTALGWAARRGDSNMMEALLRAGFAVDAPSPQVPGVLCTHAFLQGTQYQPATPLDIVASRAAELGEQRATSLLCLLLQSGASVTSMSLLKCCACRGAATLLLQHLQQACEEGRLHMDAKAEGTWYPLLRAAAECDSPAHLGHFLGRVLQLPLPDHTLASSLPKVLLRSAADHGSVGVLQRAADAAAAHAAAGDTGGEGSVVGGALGPHFAAELPWLLVAAAKEDHAAAVQLLLGAGAVPSARAVKGAALASAVGALRALLSRGQPSFDEPLQQPFELPSDLTSAYHCPILATLQHRLHRVSRLPFYAGVRGTSWVAHASPVRHCCRQQGCCASRR